MKFESLGELTEDATIGSWLCSNPISVPYYDGKEIKFTLVDLQEDKKSEDFILAVRNFLKLTVKDRAVAEKLVYKEYQEMVSMVGEQDAGPVITIAADVWNHVHPSSIYVLRKLNDQKIYIKIAAECDWEIENGIQIVYRNGNELCLVSEQDNQF